MLCRCCKRICFFAALLSLLIFPGIQADAAAASRLELYIPEQNVSADSQPGNTEDIQEEASDRKSPQTGDSENKTFLIFVCIAVVSGGTSVLMIRQIRKESKKQEI